MKKSIDKILNKMSACGVKASNCVTKVISTWTFVFTYTMSMIIWIILHKANILHIDGSDFIKFNLWLSYFAGIQASIVLMSTERQSKVDRLQADEAFKIDKATLNLTKLSHERIKSLQEQVELLESIVDELTEERKNGH
jgi:uncharacterized membrane protein